MRRITPAEYLRMPWRNGGGTTTEIVVEPAAVDRFLYRMSVADVAKGGPFSRFAGYDRHIVLIAGAGMTLHRGPGSPPIELTPFEPRSFSGDDDVIGSLAGGPVRDLNLIVDRACARASLEVRRLARRETLGAEGHACIVHVLEGALEEASEGETLLARHEVLVLTPVGDVRVAIGRVRVLGDDENR